MTTEKQVDKGISEIVGALTDPIIVFPGGWGDTLPEWLKNSITLERLVMNMKALRGEEMTGTDAEAVAYLMTLSLTQPIDSDWTQIYLYLAGKVCRQWKKVELPSDIVVDKLDNYKEQELARLKAWIYQTRTKYRQERDRVERREKREEEAARQKLLQPTLFEF